jgi:hypothetical protein
MKELMILVERAVRPVRASGRRKNRMRDELFAHANEIYEQEMARLGDAQAAIQTTALRFGESADLTRDLQASVGFQERIAFRMEYYFGWRAGESAARYTFRLSALLLLLNLICVVLTVACIVLINGPIDNLPLALRATVAMIVITGLDVFLLGLLYFKTRDAMLGPPWATKSWLRAARYGLLFAISVYASGLMSVATIVWDTPFAFELINPSLVVVALLLPLLFGAAAWVQGPEEIRRAEWARLEIE